MGDFDEFMQHTVQVRTAAGTGGMGDTYGELVTVDRVFVDETRRLVQGPSNQLVSETTILSEDLSRRDLFTHGSEVTLPSGRVASVIATSVHELPGFPQHLEVNLT